MIDTQNTAAAVTTPDRPLGLISLAQVDVPYSYGAKVVQLGSISPDQVDAPYSYGGVKVAQLGEDADEEFVVFTADRDLAVRAVDHFIREHYGAVPDEILLCDEAHPVSWQQVYNHCGCVQHQLDTNGTHLCRCKRAGLRPCAHEDADYFAWQLEHADKGDLDAIPVVFVAADFHFPA